jgi:hypothetical protein
MMGRIETPPPPRSLTHSNVLHPSHYVNEDGVECFDVLRMSLGHDGFMAFCKGNVEKYMFRYKKKGGVESLKKAEMYVHTMIQEMEKYDDHDKEM